MNGPNSAVLTQENEEACALPTCALMVLNWNGVKLLTECLPSLIAAAERVHAEVWVVDNDSRDDSAAICREQFPSVRFEALGENLFLAGYRLAAERCQTDIIVTLNNDLVAESDFLEPLLAHFVHDPEVYAVGCCLRSYPPGPQAQVETPGHRGVWENGMLRGEPTEAASAIPTLYVSGGASAHRREGFLELGGFDPLYGFYHEDVDLSWRAWKRGWKCLYEPRSIVYHKGGASIGRSEKVRTRMLRNEYLFHWKTLTSPGWIAAHILTTAPRLLLALARRDRARVAGFVEALKQIRAVRQSRKQAERLYRLNDVQALRHVNAGTI